MNDLPIDNDTLPNDINTGIRRTVLFLRYHGFATCDSGDGETHLHTCDRDHPYVVMKVAPEELVSRARDLVKLLNRAGLAVVPMAMGFNEDGDSLAPCIQASFDPADGTAILDLMGVCDDDLPDTLLVGLLP